MNSVITVTVEAGGKLLGMFKDRKTAEKSIKLTYSSYDEEIRFSSRKGVTAAQCPDGAVLLIQAEPVYTETTHL